MVRRPAAIAHMITELECHHICLSTDFHRGGTITTTSQGGPTLQTTEWEDSHMTYL